MPPASGIYVRACPRPRASRGRRDRPRPAVESRMFYARMNCQGFTKAKLKDRPLMNTAQTGFMEYQMHA
eukprot:62319-Chlamydomonas_euryale.AAC.8